MEESPLLAIMTDEIRTKMEGIKPEKFEPSFKKIETKLKNTKSIDFPDLFLAEKANLINVINELASSKVSNNKKLSLL